MKDKRTVHFLLVEDNEDHSDLISQIFEDQSQDAILECVENGEQALSFLRREGQFENAPRPDVVILDLNLPGLDGISVLKEIKGDPLLMTIPVVVLTTSNMSRDKEQAYDWCANSYVTKPVSFEGLTNTVAQLACYWAGYNCPPLVAG